MIIWGTRVFTRKKGQTIEVFFCNNCSNQTHWIFANMWTWFTLFFIPLFPVWRRQWILCPVCNCGIQLNRNNRDEIMESIELD